MSAKDAIDPFEFAARTIRQVLDARHADATPERVALVDPQDGREITYRELRRQARSLAAVLEEEGVGAGRPVAYAMANSVETVATILGILYAGRIAVAINLVAGPATVAYVIEHTETCLILADPAGITVLDAALPAHERPKTIAVDRALFERSGELSPAPVDGTTDGLVMYTSGTTGRPKGVVLSQGALLAGGANTALAHELTAADRALCVLPLYHINGLCVTVMGALVSGGSLVLRPRFSSGTSGKTCSTTVAPGSPSCRRRFPISCTRAKSRQARTLPDCAFGRSASAPLPPEVQTAFEDKFHVPIVETMGLTETAAQILSNPLPPATRKIGSPGVAVGNAVIVADDRQTEVPRGREGEVLVRGPNVMSRYLKNEAATGAALTPAGLAAHRRSRPHG